MAQYLDEGLRRIAARRAKGQIASKICPNLAEKRNVERISNQEYVD